MDNLEKEFQNVFVEAMDLATRDGLSEAIKLSSGNVSIGQLISLDHPYAKRHGMSLLPSDQINEQTGEFISKWVQQEPELNDNTITGSVLNDSNIADYLTQPNGNSKSTMVIRPIDKTVEEYIQQKLDIYILENLNKFDDMNFDI